MSRILKWGNKELLFIIRKFRPGKRGKNRPGRVGKGIGITEYRYLQKETSESKMIAGERGVKKDDTKGKESLN